MTSAWNVFGLGVAQFETILLVMARVFSMLALMPIFSQTQIPQLARVGIGLLISFVLVRTVPVMAPLLLRLSPAGSAPADTVQLSGAVPPVAVKV